MSEIGDLRAALKDNLKAGIRGVEVNTYASVNPNPPGLHLWPSAIPAAAIESDRTLGGLCHDLMVQSGTGYGALETATGTPLLTSDWLVTVLL